MERRSFIKLGATASAMALMPFELEAMLKSSSLDSCDFSKRKLILINLAGANDGLNTVVPLNQYDLYSQLRPTIKVPESGADAYINLDSGLPESQMIGLNPAMKEFKSLYDDGWLRIVQSVGYPAQNKSHFASTDLYMTGNDGNSLLNGTQSGWIGRFMEKHYYNELGKTYPLAIQIGSLSNSLGFHGEHEHGMSMNLTNQDPSGFYSVINGLGGEPPLNIPNSDFGVELQHIIDTDKLANIYAQSVSSTFDKGSNIGVYPDTKIADQLKTVARLISGGLESKVYMVKLSGFDTHNVQVQQEGDVKGKHHDLLTQLSEAVGAFCADLKALGIEEEVAGLTYSEFGRKARENGSLGTDHGEIAPMFVFGKGVKGGVSGTNPDLTEATQENNFQVQSVQYDYRQVFGTLLQSFMGAGSEVIDDTFYDHSNEQSFSSLSIDELLQEDYKVEESCQSDKVFEYDQDADDQPGIYTVSPNPCQDLIYLRCEEDVSDVFLELITSSGRPAISKNYPIVNGQVMVEVSHLPAGLYVLKVASALFPSEKIKVVKR